MKCEDFSRLIDAYIDGELDEKTAQELLSHAQECEKCAEELRLAEMLRDTLSGMDDDIVPPLPAQAAWRRAIKAESRRRKMQRVYKICGSIAAAVVLMVGVFAGLDAFGPDNAADTLDTAGTADAGFVFVATDGGDATPEPGAGAMAKSVADEDEAAGMTASVKLVSADPASACDIVETLAAELGGYTDDRGGSDVSAYLTAYIPAESIDQFEENLSLAGEVTGWQLNEGSGDTVTLTITIKTAE